jgi:hypothetical protein
MATPLGINAKVYRNTGVDYATPTWTEVDQIADLSVNPEWDEAEGGARSSRIKKSSKTMLGIEITGRIKVQLADAGYVALRDAMYTDIPLDLLILNGANDEDGVHGWRGEWNVMSGTEDQALQNRLYMDFRLTPYDGTEEPMYAEVVAGVVTFIAPGATE